MVKIELHKDLGQFKLDLSFESNSRRIGILGASGCGKSMTLRSIAGVETPDSGIVTFDGNTVYDSANKINLKPQQRRIGYLFQNYALFPTMSVRKNIAVGIKGSKEEKDRIVKEMIEKFSLQGLEDSLPGRLSGGQQQRVALARIMAYKPDIILLDEPFSALDVFLKDRLQQELLEMLSDYAGTVILVSHSRDEIYRFSEDLLIMSKGHAVCCGDAKEIFKNPQYVSAARLTGCKNIIDATRVDAHTLDVPGWGVTLHLEKEIPEEVCSVGFRAHEFIPVWGGERPKNAMGFRLISTADLPFEKKYFFSGLKEGGDEVCWFVQKDKWGELEEKGLPDYLILPEDEILLLK